MVDPKDSPHAQQREQSLVLMHQKNLFNVLEELMRQRLEEVLQDQVAFRGYLSVAQLRQIKTVQHVRSLWIHSSQDTDPASSGKVGARSLLEFSLSRMLEQHCLKSVAIKHLRSIAYGLYKCYNLDPDNHHYVMFLIKLFDFEIDELDSGATNIFLQDKRLSLASEKEEEFHAYDPFAKGAWTKKTRLTKEQVAVILWSRSVFVLAQKAYLDMSVKASRCRAMQYGLPVVQNDIEKLNSNYVLQNGGIIGVNFMFQQLRQALFGKTWDAASQAQSRPVAAKSSLPLSGDASSGDLSDSQRERLQQEEMEKESRNLFRQCQSYQNQQTKFVAMILSLNVHDVMMLDTEGGKKLYRPLIDCQLEKQVVFETQFDLWRCLLLLRNSEVDFKNFLVSTGSVLEQSKQPRPAQRCVDLVAIIKYLEAKYIHGQGKAPLASTAKRGAATKSTDTFTAGRLQKMQRLISSNL